MQMPYSQYLRIETLAGGVGCTNREFIRSAHSLLVKVGRSRAQRDARHAWIRSGLAYLDDSRDVVHRLRLL